MWGLGISGAIGTVGVIIVLQAAVEEDITAMEEAVTMPAGLAIGVILGIAAIVDTLPHGHQIVVADMLAADDPMEHRTAAAVVPAAEVVPVGAMLVVVVLVETMADIVSR